MIKQEEGDTKPQNKTFSKQTKSLVKLEDDVQMVDDDDILLLPAVSFITSNRLGGQSSIKIEIKGKLQLFEPNKLFYIFVNFS